MLEITEKGRICDLFTLGIEDMTEIDLLVPRQYFFGILLMWKLFPYNLFIIRGKVTKVSLLSST